MTVHREPPMDEIDFFNEGFFHRLEAFLTGDGTWAQVLGWDAATVYRFAQLGHDLMRSAQWDAAREIFEGCQALNPLDWHFPYCLAFTHRAQNRTQRAVDCLNLASSLAPERPEPHFMKGLCLLQVDNKQKATEAFLRSLTLCGPGDPTHSSRLAPVVRQLLARLKRQA